MTEHVTIGVETVSGGIGVDGILSVRAPRQLSRTSLPLSYPIVAPPRPCQPGLRLFGRSEGLRRRLDGVNAISFLTQVCAPIPVLGPNLIIIPPGFDAGAWDPLGRNMMTGTGYRSHRLKAVVFTASANSRGNRLFV